LTNYLSSYLIKKPILYKKVGIYGNISCEVFMFVPLHIYSSYSFLQSGFPIERLTSALKEKKYTVAALTDNQVLFGIPEFFAKSSRQGIRAIAGLDVHYLGELLTLLAIDETGYLNLVHISSTLSSTAASEELLKQHQEGLIMIVSTRQGTMVEKFVNNDSEAIVKLLHHLYTINNQFYVGIEVYNQDDNEFADFIREIGEKYNYSLVAFPFIKYHKHSDAIVLKITHAIAHDLTITEKEQSGPYYLYDQNQIESRYNENEIANTAEIAGLIDFKFDVKRGKLLRFDTKQNQTSTLCLREMAITGLQTRAIDFTNISYLQRLDYELKIIDQMGYCDYFMIVSDFVNYAHKQNIPVGPGRGSAPGSLVSYALGITDIDPIKHHLLFERFLNPARQTMPDIDIDFADERREEIVEYLRNKYGNERIANIITFQTIQSKMALRDIGRIYGYSPRTIDLLSKSLPDSKIDLRIAYKRVPAFKKLISEDKECLEIVRLATRIIGLIRQSGMHAAGIVLNEQPISESLPVLKIADHYVTQYEMDYLENQGYLKIDILGLRNLTIIDHCLQLINDNHGIALKANDLPIEDSKAFEIIASGLTMGIFQLESEGMRRAIKEIVPTRFEDIVVLLAIFRPGPMDNIASYAARKAGKENYSLLDTELNDILSPTYGIIIYQEQIMQIAEKMAGFSLSEADLFRRAVSKKDASKLVELKESFVEGAIRKGYNNKHAVSVFNHIYKFAYYGFNRSHSVAYAMISCQMAYLKAHYPNEFYASILDTNISITDDKFTLYLNEINHLKIALIAPDINRSKDRFAIVDNKLIFPLTSIKGITNDLAKKIIYHRGTKPFSDFYNFVLRMYEEKLTNKQLENLIDAGAFDNLFKSRATLRKSIPAALMNASIHSEQDNTVELVEKTKIPTARLIEAIDDPHENIAREMDVLGIVLSSSPFKHKKSLIKKYNPVAISKSRLLKGSVTIGGIIKTVKKITTKTGSPMAFIHIFDDTGEVGVTLFPRVFGEVAPLVEKHKLVVITGRYDDQKDKNLLADRITIIEEN
jgi:DNA polymerase III subunit alpha